MIGTAALTSVLFYYRWWWAALVLLPVAPLLVWYLTKEHRWQRALLTGLAAWLTVLGCTIWFWLTPEQPVYVHVNGVAFNGQYIFVSDLAAPRIVLFDTAFAAVDEWRGNLGRPAGLAWTPDGRLLIADPLNHRYALAQGGLPTEFGLGAYGTGSGQYRYPQDVAADSRNQFYIADTGNHRVVIVHAASREVVTTLDLPNGAPRGLAINPWDQSLLVADSSNNRVYVYDSVQRVVRTTLPVTGTQLLDPGDVVANTQGTIFVADTGNRRIAIFTPLGAFEREIRPDRTWSPAQLALGPGGELMVVDALSGKLLILDPTGNIVRELGRQPVWPASAQTQRNQALAFAAVMTVLAFGALLVAWIIGGLNVAPWWGLKPRQAIWLMLRTVGALFWPRRFNTAYQKVLDGSLDGPMRVAGPGLVSIQGASAVALERGGRLSRVSGPGTVLTEPGEVIRNVFDLRPQTRQFDQTKEAVYSRDAIPLEVKFTLQYRIIQNEALLVTQGRHEVKDEALRRAALNANDWHAQTEHAARDVLREVITTRRVEEIFDPRKIQIGITSPRAPLQQEMRRRLGQLTPAWGVEVLSVTLDEIRLPAPVQQRLLQVWDVEWNRLVEVGRAQTEVWALQERRQFERDEERRQLEARLTQAQLKLANMRNEALAGWEVDRVNVAHQKELETERAQLETQLQQLKARAEAELARVGLESELEAERWRLEHDLSQQPDQAQLGRMRLQAAIEAARAELDAELDRELLRLEHDKDVKPERARLQADVRGILDDIRVRTARRRAELERERTQDKAQATVTQGRAKALARVEYLRQVLNVLRDDDELLNSADPEVWQLVTRLVSFADLKAALNAYMRENALLEDSQNHEQAKSGQKKSA
jgi:sugar lactone lactonase YvrE